MVLIQTSKGTLKVELDAEHAPLTLKNFLAYADAGFYDGTIFHRVIDNFMIQGGGFTPDMKEKPTRAPIPLEARNGLSNQRGTLAMARTPNPNSATAQFFINVNDNLFLDAANARDGFGYAVFGRVVEGMEVVDAITRLEIDKFGRYGPPERPYPVPALIESIRIEGVAPVASEPANRG